MKIVFIVGSNGGDYFAVKKAVENNLLQNIEIVYMASNSSKSKAIEDFKKYNKNFYFKEDSESRDEFFSNLENKLSKLNYDYIILSGFDWLIPSTIVNDNPNKIINSHHSLLPAHPGLFKKEKLVMSDDKFLGATLHFVDNGVDTGEKLMQGVFPNYGMEKFDLVLNTYRFVQDCMIVQLLNNLNSNKSLNQKIQHKEILFNLPIEEKILKYFEGFYFEK